MVVYLNNYAFVAIYTDISLPRIFRKMEEWAYSPYDDDHFDVRMSMDNLSIVLSIEYDNTVFSMRINKFSEEYTVALYATPRAAVAMMTTARRLMEVFK